MSPVGNDRHRIRRRDKGSFAVDHVPITIAITSGPKRNIFLLDDFYERVCIRKVRIWVTTSKIGKGNTVLNTGFRKAESRDKDRMSVRPCDSV